MKTQNLFLSLATIFLIACSTDDTTDGPNDSITFESVVADSNSPADGSPSLEVLAAIGLNNLTESQEVYEVAIANANPKPTTLSELQLIIDATNADDNQNAQLPFGVNLAGAEFAEENMPGVYNQQYTYPNAEELDYYKSKGLKLIRLPFRWERLQFSFQGDLDAAELGRIKDFVRMVTERDMFVILDLHNYGRYRINDADEIIGSNSVGIADVKDLWTKLADEFKDETNIWGYGIMNEPNNMLSSTPWFSIAQEIINGIRSRDTNTTILVGGDSWSSAERWVEASDNLKDLVDPSNRIIYEAHVYFDENASGFYGNSYDVDGVTPISGVERVQPFVDWLKNNGKKGFIGEYGIPDDDPRWLVTLDNFLAHLRDNCINGTYWAAGPWWGADKMALDPRTGEESNPVNGEERPQMGIVEKYTSITNVCN